MSNDPPPLYLRFRQRQTARDTPDADQSLVCPTCGTALRYVATKSDNPALSLYVCPAHGAFTLSVNQLLPLEPL